MGQGCVKDHLSPISSAHPTRSHRKVMVLSCRKLCFLLCILMFLIFANNDFRYLFSFLSPKSLAHEMGISINKSDKYITSSD